MQFLHKIILVFILLSLNIYSQFNLQNSNVTQNLQSVYFINEDVGFIAGWQTILKTTDGGINWVQKYSGGVYFYYIKFFSNSTGIAAGLSDGNTVIFKSTNGGDNWTQVGNYIYANNGYAFVSPLVGWIIIGGQILKTTDSGTTWTSQHSPGYTLESIFMLNENTGWAVGNSNAQYRTTDGGINWVYTQLPFSPSKTLNDVFYFNSNLGWIVGENSFIAQTYNGGLNWVEQNVSEGTTFYNILFTSDLDGWTCGKSSNIAMLWKTTDSGNNWSKMTLPTAGPLRSIWSSNPENVWVVGDGGKIISNSKRLYLTSPNGGNTWQMGTNQTITWKYFNINNIKIELSINDGTSWTVLAESVPTSSNSYSFVPNSPSTDCRVRISDASNSEINDVSESKFTIQGILIQSPIGSEVWDVGTQHNINWISAGVNNLKIEYTTNNGTNWLVENASTSAASGSYIWSIPNNPSNSCKVRLTSLENQNLFSTSNNSFIIRGIKITSPNGGENWIIGTQKNITWASGGSNQVKIEYTTNDSIDWNIIVGSTPASNGSFNWTVTNPPSTQCRFKITDINNDSLTDFSDEIFIISEAPTIIITSPSSGVVWIVGTQETITWSSINVSENINIKLSVDGGTTFPHTLKSNIPNDSLEVITVPNFPSTTCRVKIESVSNPNVFGTNDGNFRIAVPSVNVVFPNGGEIFNVGTTKTITWTSQYIAEVKIEFTVNNGGSWDIIDSSYISTGSYNWTIPNNNSTQCKIKISDKTNGNYFDLSDSVFTIRDTTTNVDDFFNFIPIEYVLYQNFPNPFNPVTRIYYSIPKECQVTIKIYDILGAEIKLLVDEIKPIGNFWIDLDGNQLHSGVYIYQMRADKFNQTKKMILIK